MHLLMQQTRRGSPDGFRVRLYEAGKTYHVQDSSTYSPDTIPPALAQWFVKRGWGEMVG